MNVASAWDAEYAAGRYDGEEPVDFVHDVVASWPAGGRGLYIGCGNGRNYVPLREAGLDLVGVDISKVAIDSLAARLPQAPLVHGALSALGDGAAFDGVIGIQVFQHGNRAQAHRHIAAAQGLVRPGGIFCMRVNAAGTDVWPEHVLVEVGEHGDFTVNYREGPKRGLDVHFFSREALAERFSGWDEVLPLRLRSTARHTPAPGQWSQWEAIWRRP